MKKYDATIIDETVKAGRCETVLRMYSDFRTQLTDACGPSDLPLLNVALAYEDLPSGTLALRTFHDLFQVVEEQCQFNMHNAWKFDFLRINRLREMAVAETTRADLIIISMRTPGELPPPVKWWLAASLEKRDGDPGALVLLHEETWQNAFQRPAAEVYLAQCAQNAGLDFFVKRVGAKRGIENQDTDAGSRDAALIGARLSTFARPNFNPIELNELNRR